MALVRKKNYKKIAVYSIFLIILIGGGAYYLYTSLSGDGSVTKTNTSLSREKPIVRDYDREFIETGSYRNLVEFGAETLPLDLEAIEKGRANPFNRF